MVIFLYNLYIIVWIYHGCLANMVFALDPRDTVIKRLWCIYVKLNCMSINIFTLKTGTDKPDKQCQPRSDAAESSI